MHELSTSHCMTYLADKALFVLEFVLEQVPNKGFRPMCVLSTHVCRHVSFML
jgi:hypothetical protein